MPDFPYQGAAMRVPPAINTLAADTPAGHMVILGGAGGLTTAAWSTANTAIYMPFTISFPYLAQKMATIIGVQSGNIDVGIYDEKGNLLVSMGSTAVAAAGLQVFNITDTWLMPGTYFMAMNVDNTTATVQAAGSTPFPVAVGRTCGIQIQAVGAVTLPNPATFATYSARNVPAIMLSGATI